MKSRISIYIINSKNSYWFQKGKCLLNERINTAMEYSNVLKVRTTKKARTIARGIFDKFPDVDVILIERFWRRKNKHFNGIYVFRDYSTQRYSKEGLE